MTSEKPCQQKQRRAESGIGTGGKRGWVDCGWRWRRRTLVAQGMAELEEDMWVIVGRREEISRGASRVVGGVCGLLKTDRRASKNVARHQQHRSSNSAVHAYEVPSQQLRDTPNTWTWTWKSPTARLQ